MIMTPKKPNNSNDGDLQPYNPENGEYLENEYSNDLYNLICYLNTNKKYNYVFHFPKKGIHGRTYFSSYINEIIDWEKAYMNDSKINFLINPKEAKKKRYLTFRNELGYNENNFDLLKKQILENAYKYKAYILDDFDEFGLRVKIYMPIYYYNEEKYLIIKTVWLVNENEPPKFITAYYEKEKERKYEDEI